MPRLRILAGPSLADLVPISANSDVPLEVKSDAFEGQVAVYVKGFADTRGAIGDSAYFHKRADVTWSIQVQGRFLHQYSADDILFGNTFERPLKLPWGFSAALKFMHYVDPTLEQDLASTSKPWALSPLISTMPYLSHRPLETGEPLGPFPPPEPIQDDLSHLRLADGHCTTEMTKNRRSFFADTARRKAVVFGPEDVISADFCYNYLRFSPAGVDLRLPGGVSIDMMKYWDGQPVRFVCCERARGGESEPWGRVLWCVVIEPVDEDEVSEKGEDGR